MVINRIVKTALHFPNSKFDINISPDKREVLLSEGAKIYDALRNALGDLLSGQSDGVFVANEVEDACLEKNRPIINCEKGQNSTFSRS